MKINIKNVGLTGYYLSQKFDEYPNESGISFNQVMDCKEEIEINYKDMEDLEEKISFILMVLTDK